MNTCQMNAQTQNADLIAVDGILLKVRINPGLAETLKKKSPQAFARA
jgi:hypothetical protein